MKHQTGRLIGAKRGERERPYSTHHLFMPSSATSLPFCCFWASFALKLGGGGGENASCGKIWALGRSKTLNCLAKTPHCGGYERGIAALLVVERYSRRGVTKEALQLSLWSRDILGGISAEAFGEGTCESRIVVRHLGQRTSRSKRGSLNVEA